MNKTKKKVKFKPFKISAGDDDKKKKDIYIVTWYKGIPQDEGHHDFHYCYDIIDIKRQIRFLHTLSGIDLETIKIFKIDEEFKCNTHFRLTKVN